MALITGKFWRCRYKKVTAVAAGTNQQPQNVVSADAVVNAADQNSAYTALVADLGFSTSTTVSIVLEYGFEEIFPGMPFYQ
jgi:hypothetical protein